jgi:hypothetical protein
MMNIKYKSLAAGALALQLLTANPAEAKGFWLFGEKWFGYKPNVEMILNDFSDRDKGEIKHIEEILNNNFRTYIDKTPNVRKFFNDNEMRIMASLIDATNSHESKRPDTYIAKPNIFPEATKQFIKLGTQYNLNYTDLLNILSLHNDLNLKINMNKEDVITIESLPQMIIDSSKYLIDAVSGLRGSNYNMTDALLITKALLESSSGQNSYTSYTRPASDIMNKIPNDLFDDASREIASRILTTSRIVSSNGSLNDEEKSIYLSPSKIADSVTSSLLTIVNSAKQSPGMMGFDYGNEKSLKILRDRTKDYSRKYNDIFNLFSQIMPDVKDPATYSRHVNDLFRHSVEYNITLDNIKNNLLQAKQVIENTGSEVTSDKIIGLALRLPLDELANSLVIDNIYKSDLFRNKDTMSFLNTLNNDPFIKDNIQILRFNDEIYKPVNEANYWKNNLEVKLKQNGLSYNDLYSDISRNVFDSLRNIRLKHTKRETLEDNNRIAIFEHVKGYAYTRIDNSIEYTISIGKTGFSPDASISFMKYFSDLTQDKEQLAYVVKNSARVLESAKEKGHSINSARKILDSIVKSGRRETSVDPNYLNPEKIGNSMVYALSQLKPNEVDRFSEIIHMFSDTINKEPGYLNSIKGSVDSNMHLYPAIMLTKSSLQKNDLEERLNSMISDTQTMRADSQDRPWIYSEAIPPVINPEKAVRTVLSPSVSNFYKSNDPLVSYFRGFFPKEINKVLEDNPNIAEKTLREYKISTPHLNDDQRIRILNTVQNLNLDRNELDNIVLSNIHNNERNYLDARDSLGLYFEKLVTASKIFGNNEKITMNDTYLNQSLNLLTFLNERCRPDINEDSWVLFTRNTGTLISETLNRGLEIPQIKYLVENIISIPQMEVSVGNLRPNIEKYNPPEKYNFKSISKVYNSITSLYNNTPKDYTFDDFYHIVEVAKHLSFLSSAKEDPNEFLKSSALYIRELKIKNNAKTLSGEEISKGINILYDAFDAKHNYDKPEKLVTDAINRYNEYQKRSTGFFR